MEAVKTPFVPAFPTLWPEMLVAKPRRWTLPPFAAGRAHFFYFARNAVWLTARFLELHRGEVLVPAYHHGVEIEALIDAGAKVRFYRVGKKWDVDVEDVRRKLTPQTRAIYLIHYAGFPGPVAELQALAQERGIPLIEDCALSLLSSDGATPLGSTGDVSIFCLYKTLPVPNGGALVLNGERSYTLPKALMPPQSSAFSHTASALLRNIEMRGGAFGRAVRSAIRLVGKGTVQAAKVERVATGTQHFNRAHVELGMSPLTKRLALVQDVAGIIERRRRNYFNLLGKLRELAPPLFSELPPGVCPLFYPLLVADKTAVAKRLQAEGIEVVDFWRHFHPACDRNEYPEIAQLRESVLEIPCHQDLSPEVMDVIAQRVRAAVIAERERPIAAGA